MKKKKKEAVTWHASSKHVSFIACLIALKLSNTHKVMYLKTLKNTHMSQKQAVMSVKVNNWENKSHVYIRSVWQQHNIH